MISFYSLLFYFFSSFFPFVGKIWGVLGRGHISKQCVYEGSRNRIGRRMLCAVRKSFRVQSPNATVAMKFVCLCVSMCAMYFLYVCVCVCAPSGLICFSRVRINYEFFFLLFFFVFRKIYDHKI